MKQIRLRRSLPVGVSEAFAWFTDYTPDDSTIFGDPPGGRTVSRISGTEFELTNRYPGSSLTEKTHVILFPPARWSGKGTLSYGRFRIAEYSQEWELSQAPEGCELIMTVSISIVSLAARLYLFLRPDYITKEIEAHYDRIRTRLIEDAGPKKQW